MRQHPKSAFTLVELLVVIAIIGTLVALLLPAVQAARETARSNTCRSNMTNLQKALTQREQTLREFPGYINVLGPAGGATNTKLRASWVVTTFPYIEQPALWDAWNAGGPMTTNHLADIEILVCPSDPPVSQGQPEMAYVVNAGWIQQETPTSSGAAEPAQGTEKAANGVFTDRTRTRSLTPGKAGAPPPDDSRDVPTSQPPDPEVVMTSAYIQSKGDGMTNTLMLSESLTAHQWAYNQGTDPAEVPDRKYHFGFCWEDPEVAGAAPASDPNPATDPSFRKINGQRIENSPAYDSFSQLVANHGFPSSNHPGGVNMAFCGGQVQFVSDQITPQVYAQLMTSNRKGSDLRVGPDDLEESKLKQPSDGEY